jgi:hypothetical protein
MPGWLIFQPVFNKEIMKISPDTFSLYPHNQERRSGLVTGKVTYFLLMHALSEPGKQQKNFLTNLPGYPGFSPGARL